MFWIVLLVLSFRVLFSKLTVTKFVASQKVGRQNNLCHFIFYFTVLFLVLSKVLATLYKLLQVKHQLSLKKICNTKTRLAEKVM